MRDFSYAVLLPEETTQVFLGPLAEVPLEAVAETGCLVVDDRIDAARAQALGEFAARLVRRPSEPIVLSGGEDLKTVAAAAEMWTELFARGFDRGSLIIAAGGGSLLDAVGFAAATFLRGIALLAVPTTLLAQLDAALGGKCALNVDGVKNQIGLIRQPRYVVVDLAFLDGLSEPAFRSGLGELAKSALLAGGELHALVLRRAAEIQARGRDALEQAVFLALRAKAGVVARDPLDRGERAILNAGHTAGHVIEAEGLRRGVEVPHGDAVAVGLAIEAEVDPRSDRDAVRGVLDALALPRAAPFKIGTVASLALLLRDKKRRGSLVSIPVIEAPGTVVLRDVSLEQLAAVISGEPPA